MRLVSIASGSSGNCIYVGNDSTHLLVDAGISMVRTKNGLEELGIDFSLVDGILITHEHGDHIGGLGPILRKYQVPVYATKGTIAGIMQTKGIGKIDPELFHCIKPEDTFHLKDISVNPIQISHDANEPVAYRFQYEDKKISILTDLGYFNDYITESIKGSDILFVEANHDIRMLQVGRYPYPLKQRILGDRGHLCNENCGRLISKVLHDDVKSIMLGHLSKENNLPELAYETVKLEITMSENQYNGNDFPIYVAKRDTLSQELVC